MRTCARVRRASRVRHGTSDQEGHQEERAGQQQTDFVLRVGEVLVGQGGRVPGHACSHGAPEDGPRDAAIISPAGEPDLANSSTCLVMLPPGWRRADLGCGCNDVHRLKSCHNDELLRTEVARPDYKINSAAAEKRRLVDLFQAGLIDMSELPRGSREVTSRHNELAAKRTAVAAERRTGAGQLTRPVSHRLRRLDPRRHQSTRPQTSPTKTQRPATGV